MGENEGGPEAVADREEESDAAEAVTMTHGENEGAPDKKGGSTQGTRRKGVAAFRPRGQCLSRSPPLRSGKQGSLLGRGGPAIDAPSSGPSPGLAPDEC